MTNHISKTRKMDGIRSWSLPAGKSCPGALNHDGTLVEACQGCYAKTGCYVFPIVKKARENNMVAWQDPDWVNIMIKELNIDRYFRWFDSGDVYCPQLADKIYQIMVCTPWCNHWLPTRSYKFEKIKVILEKMKKLDNVMVRYSSDSIFGEYESGLHGSTIIPSEYSTPKNVFLCPAYRKTDNKCSGCRACWDKNVGIIAYTAHGQPMKKIIKNYL